MLKMMKSALLGVIALAVAPLIVAQGITTGTISGTVTDPSGAVISGTQVVLTNEASGLQLAQKSAADGSFIFLLVPIGTYHVLVRASGFADEQVNSIQVVSGATTNLNGVKLRVATGNAEEVEVNVSIAALLETTDSQVTTTFNSESMQTLPLNNGFDTVVELIPGVVGTGADSFSNTNGDNYSVNGQSGRYNNFEIDGQSNNDSDIAGPQVFFGNQDAIQQLQVITNDYSAQYGRNAGAVENYITKSGTNSFHGSAFDLYQGQFLSSLSNTEKNPLFGFCPPGVRSTTGCAAPVLPRYVENRAGATVGGPIFREISCSSSSAPIGIGSARVCRRLSLCPVSPPTQTASRHFNRCSPLIPAQPRSSTMALTPSRQAIRSRLPCLPISFLQATTARQRGICLEPVTDASGKTRHGGRTRRHSLDRQPLQ